MTKTSLATTNACKRAMAWYVKVAGLQAWKIGLWVSKEPPKWMGEVDNVCIGRSICTSCEKRADVWVSPERSARDNAPLLQTLFHELFHVSLNDSGNSNPDTAQAEFFVNRMAWMATRAYCGC